LVILGLTIRLKLEESPEFQALKDANAIHPAPLVEVFRNHLREVVLVAGAAIGNSVTFYATSVFGLACGTSQGFSRNQVLAVIIVSAAWVIVASVCVGALSDRLGRKPLFIVGNSFVALMIFPWILAMQSGRIELVLCAYLVLLTGFRCRQGLKRTLSLTTRRGRPAGDGFHAM
jgi:hypothetical protein